MKPRLTPALFGIARYATALLFTALVTIEIASAQELRVGQGMADSLSAESAHSYTINAEANRYVYGFADQISVDVVVKVTAPSGLVIGTFDSPRRGPETFQFFTDESGEYKVEVTPFERAQGRYRIELVTNERKQTNPKKLVDQLMRPFSGTDRPGVAVSVLKNGKVVFAEGYGMANLTDGVPMTENSGMSIASVSKQFTAMAIVLLEQDGKLSLDDDVRKYIPELKDFGTPVTLRNLLNHTSGYREILNMLPFDGWDATDAMSRDQLIKVIQRQPQLQNTPGAEYNYNNTAFGLLATVVERASGEDFRPFMERRIFRPLGMDHTTIKTHQGQVIPGSSQGYDNAEDGGFKYVTDFASLYGASGVNSTALDMTKWMLNYRDAKVGGRDAIDKLTTRGILTSGDTTGYALGLGVGKWRGQTRYSHSGGETSHRSYFAYFPEIDCGVFISSNHPSFSREVWNDIADAFFGELLDAEEAPAAQKTAPTTGPTAAQLEAITGKYQFVGASLVIEYTVENGRLYGQATNQPRFALDATSDSTFSFVGVPASVTFHYEADGSVKRGMHHQGGNSPIKRLEPVEMTDEEKRAYTGRYFMEELETVYTVTLRDGKLMMEHVRYDPFELTHRSGDEFTGGIWFMTDVKFYRDPNGEISGFTASNGRTRGVWAGKMRE